MVGLFDEGVEALSDYKALKVVFHQAKTDAKSVAEKEHEQRLLNPATIHFPYQVDNYSLFVVAHIGVQVLLERIWRRELAIEQLWGQMPGAAQSHYLFTLLVDEIQSSNEIENIYSTRQEIAEALESAQQAPKKNAAKGRRRFQEMARTYSILFGNKKEAGEEFPRTLKGVRNLYDRLLGEEISSKDQLDGDLFRAGPVHIWDGNKEPIHSGVVGESEIKARLSAMLEAHGDSADLGLIGAFVGHFMLEHTHPFYDGNGRFGRFLLALRLKTLLSAPTAISLSAEVMRQKDKYYKAFKQLEDPMNKGEATFFVTDLLVILASAQERLEESLLEKWKSLQQLMGRIEALSSKEDAQFSEYQLGIFLLLGQVALFGPRSGVKLENVAEFLDKSKQTARRELASLVDAGYLEELSRKPLVFALSSEGRELFELGRN